jgi:putative oxidoreductase
MDKSSHYLSLVGRVLVSTLFLLSALGKITGWSTTAGYMASKGMPLVPFFLAAAILIELGGGLSVLTGFQARWGALALAAFLIPTTLIFHNFWAFHGPEQQAQMINFLKNVAIMGGLLQVAASAPASLRAAAHAGKMRVTQQERAQSGGGPTPQIG